MPIRIVHREGAASPKKRSAGSMAARTAPRGRRERTTDSASAPDPAEVARLAYFYWESRGGRGGTAEEDWLRAEGELRQRSSVTDI